jgi:hypothetical protein
VSFAGKKIIGIIRALPYSMLSIFRLLNVILGIYAPLLFSYLKKMILKKAVATEITEVSEEKQEDTTNSLIPFG